MFIYRIYKVSWLTAAEILCFVFGISIFKNYIRLTSSALTQATFKNIN